MSEIKLPKLRKIDPNKPKKKKILLLSDDLRMFSGIATQSKEFVLGTIDKYDWVQLSGAVNHPENGKIIDMSTSIRDEFGIDNAYLKLYPISGYGNPDLLRNVLEIEKPDAIIHFTDPRFWIWLYNMEHEIRQNIPIMYYNIWDDLPDPEYNKYFYKSCDLLLAISKQTYGINKRLLPEYEDWQIKYLPHGINQEKYFKLNKNDFKLKQFQQKFGLDNDKFKLLYLNRNIRRKQPGDFVLAYTEFLNKLSTFERDNCCLVIHAEPVDDNGTDIRALTKQFMPEQSVIFTYDIRTGFNDDEMNYLYNSVDVYMNIASNEGFGLGTAEAVMSGTPIVVNVTGGLQDQCGFKIKGKHVTPEDYDEIESFHDDRKWKDNPDLTHGEWVKPVWPSSRSLQGSIPTPYIFDDRCRWDDVADRFKEWYDTPKEERREVGQRGREWMLQEEIGMSAKLMCERFIHDMEVGFEKWTPRKRFTLYKA